MSLAPGIVLLAIGLVVSWPTAQSRPPIIDMHLHAQDLWAEPDTDAATVFGPVFGERTLGIRSARNADHLREATLAALEKHNVVRAVVSGPHASVYRKSSPERILAGLEVRGSESVDSVRAELVSGRYRLIAEMAPQYLGLSPADPSLAPIFALAEELDLPVGLHMGIGPPGAAYGSFPKYRMTAGDPLLLEDVLVRHPRLRLYVMHAGWPRINEMIALMHAHPQVHVDVGVINWYLPEREFYAYFQRLVDAGFGRRIMFGTDQMIWPDAIGRAIEVVERAPFLTEEGRRDIMCRNAARFLRLDLTVCE